jgi:hypothetical protein
VAYRLLRTLPAVVAAPRVAFLLSALPLQQLYSRLLRESDATAHFEAPVGG